MKSPFLGDTGEALAVYINCSGPRDSFCGKIEASVLHINCSGLPRRQSSLSQYDMLTQKMVL